MSYYLRQKESNAVLSNKKICQQHITVQEEFYKRSRES